MTALVLAVVVALAGCGSGSEEEVAQTLSDTEHNAADVAFATGMVQHHAQALTMVDLTRGRPLAPQVEQLAEDVRATQGPEIETMVDWLQQWDEPVPETVRDHANAGHGHGGMGEAMTGTDTDLLGMMSAEQMIALERASDDEFEALWLEMMVEHHRGAVEMAQAESEQGRYRPAVRLARQVVEGQTAEVERMERLLEPTRSAG